MANRMVIRYVSIIPGTGMMMKKNILAQWQAEWQCRDHQRLTDVIRPGIMHTLKNQKNNDGQHSYF